MRLVKFRGKPIQMTLPSGEELLGDFVVGNLITHKDGVCRILVPIDGGFENYKVSPSTISQFTSLCDKNGNEIYEGDILRVNDSTNVVCEFRHCAFGYTYCNEFHPFAGNTNYTFNPKNTDKDFEVIGNIHDNPELLKGGGK